MRSQTGISGTHAQEDAARQAAALLGWWQLAGVDVAMGDQPYGWLDVPAPAAIAAPVARPITQAAQPAPAANEDWARFTTLDALLAHLREQHPHAPILDGAIESGTLLVGDAPSAEDLRSGRPFSGTDGQMLDRMMAAIGLDRTHFAVTLLAPLRAVPGPLTAEAMAAEDVSLARALIRLAAPERLLLLGAVPAQALSGDRRPIASLRGQWLQVEAGKTIPALVTLRPSYLRQRPEAKAQAWADLLLFRKGLS